MKAIIFSKDRAAQLELLLDSIAINARHLFDEICIVYHYSEENYKLAYEKLKNNLLSKHSSHKLRNVLFFLKQEELGSFYNALITAFQPFSKLHTEAVCFLTDDDIFYRPITYTSFRLVELIYNYELSCFSFRLGSNTLIQDQYIRSRVDFPKAIPFNGDLLRWNWRSVRPFTNFGYPLSVDGHIFLKRDLEKYINQLDKNISNPNALEGSLQSVNVLQLLPETMGCFLLSCVVNTPNNRVQEVCPNQNGIKYGITQSELNQLFMDNYKLSYDDMDFTNIAGCHQELELKWVQR